MLCGNRVRYFLKRLLGSWHITTQKYCLVEPLNFTLFIGKKGILMINEEAIPPSKSLRTTPPKRLDLGVSKEQSQHDVVMFFVDDTNTC